MCNWVIYAESRRTVTSEAQDDDSEEELDGANAKGDDFEHAWSGNCTKRKLAVSVGGVRSNRL